MPSEKDHCHNMEALATSTFLRTVLTFNFFSCLIAFPMVLAASYSLWKTNVGKLLHINVIIIFQVHLFGFFIHCFSRIILHALDLFSYALLDYCDMPPSTLRCFVFRVQYVFGINLVSATTVPMLIERCIATIKSSSYEGIGVSLGIAMAALQINISTFVTFISFRNYSFEEPVTDYCISIRMGKVSSHEKMAFASLLVQILARFLFHCLFNMNKNLRMKQQTSTLSNRYSLEQNMKSMRTLKMFADLQSAFMIIHIMLLICILRWGAETDTPTYIALIELNSPYPLYAVVSIILLLKKEHVNKVRLKKALDSHVNADQNKYFENFKKDLS